MKIIKPQFGTKKRVMDLNSNPQVINFDKHKIDEISKQEEELMNSGQEKALDEIDIIKASASSINALFEAQIEFEKLVGMLVTFALDNLDDNGSPDDMKSRKLVEVLYETGLVKKVDELE